MTDAAGTHATQQREFVVTRVFDAPRELVWRAWTQPEHFARWWGSHGTTTPLETTRMDVRPGGEWYATLRVDADGTEHPFAGVYREIVDNERLVLTLTDSDRPDPERQHLLTVTLSDVDGGTQMIFSQAGDFGDTPDDVLRGLTEGYAQFFDRLAASLGQADGERRRHSHRELVRCSAGAVPRLSR
jgi:uncharacterized protein YndB with AHSA1/START domain